MRVQEQTGRALAAAGEHVALPARRRDARLLADRRDPVGQARFLARDAPDRDKLGQPLDDLSRRRARARDHAPTTIVPLPRSPKISDSRAFLWFPLTMWTAPTPDSATREISWSLATIPPVTAELRASFRACAAVRRETRLSGCPGAARTPGTSESRMSFSAASSIASAEAIASALTLKTFPSSSAASGETTGR